MISAVTLVSGIDWYPFVEVLQSVRPIADEVVVNIDTGSQRAIDVAQSLIKDFPDDGFNSDLRILYRAWDWQAKDQGQELARQANAAVNEAMSPWVLYVQADEVLHQDEHAELLRYVRGAPSDISGFRLDRLYFFGRPDLIRTDWSQPLTRLFRKGTHLVVGDGMDTQTLLGRVEPAHGVRLFHYSRLAPEGQIVDRIMSLSKLFHDEATLHRPETYDWKTRKFDTFSTDNRHEAVEVDPDEVLTRFEGTHPIYIRKWLRAQMQ